MIFQKNKGSNSNTQQALWLAISSFSSLALAFLSSAILSRYFDKTEYGTYRQILYVYGTLQTIFTVGLPSVFAYFIPRYSNEEGKYFVNKINTLFVVLGCCFSLLLFLSSDLIADILQNRELARGLKVFSIFPLFTLPTLGVEGLYTALRRTKDIAIYNTISKLLMLACIVLPVVYIKGDYVVAIMGWGAASFVIFIYAMYMKSKPYFGIAKKRIEKFYSTVFNYSTPLMAASIVGFFIASSNQFFISRYYGTEKFAEFSNGFLSLPMIAMVGTSLKGVLLPLFSKAQKDSNLAGALFSYNSAVKRAVLVLLPMVVFCFVFGEQIMIFVYGKLYSSSTPFFRVSLFRDIFQILPYAAVLLALGHTKMYFKSHLVSAIVLLPLSYLISKLEWPPITIIILFVVIETSRHLYLFNFIYRKEKMNLIPISMIKKILTILIHSMLVSVPICFVAIYISEHISFLLLRIIINLILFYSLLFLSQGLFKLNYYDPFKTLILKK